MPERVRVALIGAGRIGLRHARTLATRVPRADLVAVADAIPEAARSTAATVRLERWTTEAASLFADPSIDAIVIASSTETHAPYIIAAAEAGKDIFCEKPIALDLAATDAALEAVERSGVRLQIGFQRRFDKGYRRAKEMIESGTLGRIESLRDTMRDPAPASREYIAGCGGLFRDMTIHNFDTVRWLMGAEVEEVYAMGSALVDPLFAELDDIDTSVVTLRFVGGSLAVIDNSRRSGFGYDVRTEVFGSEGATFVGYRRETPVLHLSQDGVKSDHVTWFLDRFDQAYEDELHAFIDGCITREPPEVTGEDGRAAMVLAYAAEAARRDNRPVRVEEFARMKHS
ncbi:MAG: inositol 2-dehydrogenase [Chloroflexota bacterium]|nr:inositol 2-dehydrogenase [Chloroflexota bacterium]